MVGQVSSPLGRAGRALGLLVVSLSSEACHATGPPHSRAGEFAAHMVFSSFSGEAVTVRMDGQTVYSGVLNTADWSSAFSADIPVRLSEGATLSVAAGGTTVRAKIPRAADAKIVCVAERPLNISINSLDTCGLD